MARLISIGEHKNLYGALGAVLLSFLFAALVSSGCSEKTTGPAKKFPFSLKVTVVDSIGNPIEGMPVGRRNYLDDCWMLFTESGDQSSDRQAEETGTGVGSRDHDVTFYQPVKIDIQQPPGSDSLMHNFPDPVDGVTIIRYNLAEQRYVLLDVVDWRGDHVKTLVEAIQNEGAYRIHWDSRDELGNRVIDGVYTYRLNTKETGTLNDAYLDSLRCTVYISYVLDHVDIGYTDENGEFETDDVGYFPGLIGHDPVECHDIYGVEYGACSFKTNVTIIIHADVPAQGSALEHHYLYYDVDLVRGRNTFKIVWPRVVSVAGD